MDTRSCRSTRSSGQPSRTMTTGTPWVNRWAIGQRALTQLSPMVSTVNTDTASSPEVIE
jgi:hypothetical protein